MEVLRNGVNDEIVAQQATQKTQFFHLTFNNIVITLKALEI